MRTALLLFLCACGTSATTESPDAATTPGPDAAPAGCTLTANTTPTGTTSPTGCDLVDRDTSSCAAARTAAGLSGFWLNFSCRVSLSVSGGTITATSDGQPDYTSMYFPTTDPCYVYWADGTHNPNSIVAQTTTVKFPASPNTTATAQQGGTVGLALNGVVIFDNQAAPGDDIYQESVSFDRCAGHPQMSGVYHYHTEPFSLSYDDDRFVGVLRDGYPVYGRKDPDGSYPADLDAYGGHTGFTVDSPATAVYHYHTNLQTSTAPTSQGQTAWFLTTGMYRGAPTP